MSDKAALKINGTSIENFKSFSVSADLYTADSSFQMELSDPETVIQAGQQCELKINGITELTGLIDKPTRKWSKDETHFSIEGRSLMGLLVDSYCENFITLTNKKLKDVANLLLKTVPFINRKNIIYQLDLTGSLKSKHPPIPLFSDADNPMTQSQILPNMTIFDVLKQYAMSQGLMFYNLPDGTFVFGTLKKNGKSLYSLILRKKPNAAANNVLEVECSEDYSKRYSKVTVRRQMQPTPDTGLPPVSDGKASSPDKDFPFYKPYVTETNYPSQSPKAYADLIMDKQKHDAFNATYKVPGFSQNGLNWAINELVHIKDEVNSLNGTYLIHGRTFERSKAGSFTTLRIGLPGGTY